MDLALKTYNGWCAIEPNQNKTNQIIVEILVLYCVQL